MNCSSTGRASGGMLQASSGAETRWLRVRCLLIVVAMGAVLPPLELRSRPRKRSARHRVLGRRSVGRLSRPSFRLGRGGRGRRLTQGLVDKPGHLDALLYAFVNGELELRREAGLQAGGQL